MKIAAYCRVSTDKEEQLDSLAHQREFFLEYASQNGHELVKLYADEGISGISLKRRTEFQRLIRDAGSGQFQMVVVKDVSRFARNTVDFLQSIRALKSFGINTLFLTANMESLGESEFILTVFSALAQEESVNLSKRVKFGKKITAKKGRVPPRVFGYDRIDNYTLTVNRHEARIVREIYRLFLDEGLECRRISEQLNSLGYKTKLGHKYTEGKWQTVTALDCVTDHVEGILCENCKEPRETRTVQKAPGHKYTAGQYVTVSSAGCVEDGLSAVICSVCDTHVSTKVIPATGHTVGQWETVSVVGCTVDGIRIKNCTVCGDMVDEEITPARHTFDANKWEQTLAPTCTKDGESAVICSVCGEKVKTKPISATGHSFGEWYVKTSPTYLKEGVLRRDCGKCTFNENKSIAVLKTEIVHSGLSLDSSKKILGGIIVNTKVSDVLAKIENASDVKIVNKDGKRLSEDDFIGSGSRLVLYEGSRELLSYSITVKGDADGNGLANDWDCILLGRYLAGWDVDICLEALDFDKNGVVNDWDEILFSRYLASWDIKLW